MTPALWRIATPGGAGAIHFIRDGSDLMVGGKGYDRQQVNFYTDLVNDDLQNDDVAEFSVTDKGIQFARIELNDQTSAACSSSTSARPRCRKPTLVVARTRR